MAAYRPSDEQSEALWEAIDVVEAVHPYALPNKLGWALYASVAMQDIIQSVQEHERQRLASLVHDPERGLPFDDDHDRATVAAWLAEA